MPLFRGHVLRSTLIAVLLIFAAHRVIKHMPESMHVFTLTQTSIAIIALATVMLMTVTHHRRQGQVLSQTQEELLLVVAFALFWLSAFVAYRAFGQRKQPGFGLNTGAPQGMLDNLMSELNGLNGRGPPLPPSRANGRSVDPRAQPPPLRAGVQTERPGQAPAWPCSGDAFACVVEEWTYY